jgi:hypothetical protein
MNAEKLMECELAGEIKKLAGSVPDEIVRFFS